VTTLKDIAEETGFSIKTVSRAIHNHPDIKLETKEIIMEVVRKRGFTPNWAAQSLRNQKTNTIGYIIPNITNGFFSEIGIAIDAFLLQTQEKMKSNLSVLFLQRILMELF